MSCLNFKQNFRLLFKNQNKFFIKAINKQFNSITTCTLVLIAHEEQIEHGLKKIIQKINDSKKNRFMNLIYPETTSVENIQNSKMILLPLDTQLLPLYYFVQKNKRKFNQAEIIEAAYCGFRSLKQLHSLHIVHGQINPLTFYFFNREHSQQGHPRTKNLRETYFGVGIMDINFNRQKVHKNQSESPIQKKIFHSKNKMLGLNISYKDDLQQFIYILVFIISRGSLFSPQRYQDQWRTPEGLHKWKLNQLYFEIIKTVPSSLWVIVQLYLEIHELGLDDKSFDYDRALKKIGKIREKILADVSGSFQSEKQDSDEKPDEQQQSRQLYLLQNKEADEFQIEQQQIRLTIRPEYTVSKDIFRQASE